MRFVVVALTLTAGCYSPTVSSCAITCSDTEPCPNDLQCVGGLCVTDDTAECAKHTLTIRTTGDGLVTGPGVECSGTCTVDLTIGMHELHAVPDNDARVSSWALDMVALPTCNGIDCPTVIDMTTDRDLEVTFDPAQTITIERAGDGFGTVGDAAAGLICTGSSCVGRFPPGTELVLQADETPPSEFQGWQGCVVDPVAANRCTVVLDTARTVSAEFDVIAVTVIPLPNGQGVVELVDGLNQAQTCASNCTYYFPPSGNNDRTLTIVKQDLHELAQWINHCEGSRAEACGTTFTDDTFVIALFRPFPTINIDVRSAPNGPNGAVGGVVQIGDTNPLKQCGFVSPGVTAAEFCPHRLTTGTELSLRAVGTVNAEMQFGLLAWGGSDCPSGSTGSGCLFTVNGDLDLAPTFGATLEIRSSGVNPGSVLVDDGQTVRSCTSTSIPCQIPVQAFAPVTLRVVGGDISGWTRCPDPNDANMPECTFTLLGGTAPNLPIEAVFE